VGVRSVPSVYCVYTVVVTVRVLVSRFLTVANETMCRPIRALTEARGYSTAKHILSCFGGAGGKRLFYGAAKRHPP
jgi:N-methylhydantoinase A/oxoprolinase/acetone carboxylase beta subunit